MAAVDSRWGQRPVLVPVTPETRAELERAEEHSAHNYDPLPIVITSGSGAWVRGIDGLDYLDVLAGYSALNFGHAHPELVAIAREQIGRLTLTSRAFQHDRFAEFCTDVARLCRKDAVLPMNTGVEAVETAIKLARKWGYDVKGVPDGRAEIITCAGNFHGRTIAVVGFSTDPEARGGFGPFAPGFVSVEYGDVAAVAKVLLGDVLKVDYLVDPRVEGTISLSSARPIPRKDILPLLENALQLNGAVVSRQGEVYQIVLASEAAGTGSVDVGSRRVSPDS